MNERMNALDQTGASDHSGIQDFWALEALGVLTVYRNWFQRICLRLELRRV